ncbi:MAG: hypothetical protein HY958_05055 [Bacteroidia bacterium]|nr:hypothetical protein [Bacteroidia bacterium]
MKNLITISILIATGFFCNAQENGTITGKSPVKNAKTGKNIQEQKANNSEMNLKAEQYNFSANCNLPKTLVIEKNNINLNYIIQQLPKLEELFTIDNIKNIEKKINECNNEVDNSIARLKNIATSISLDKQELIKIKDVKKIKEQIAEKEKSRESIKEQIKTDLAAINLKGLYICVQGDLNRYGGPSQSELGDKSLSLIAPTAIYDINGSFLTSITDLYKNEKSDVLVK